jgi:rod shape-determining protein MreD
MSVRARRRVWEIALAGMLLCTAYLLQLTVLSLLSFNDVICNLPLVITIIWGSVFGSPLSMPRPEDVRRSSLSTVLTLQALSGSLSGALVGAFFGALYSSVLPIYPICYPIVGWVSGYFCLSSFNQATLLCIPLVLLATALAETITAAQLYLMHRPDVLGHLAEIAVAESILNALIAPFVYFPMRGWFEFSKLRDPAGAQ